LLDRKLVDLRRLLATGHRTISPSQGRILPCPI
jgi:hypothetical protein